MAGKLDREEGQGPGDTGKRGLSPGPRTTWATQREPPSWPATGLTDVQTAAGTGEGQTSKTIVTRRRRPRPQVCSVAADVSRDLACARTCFSGHRDTGIRKPSGRTLPAGRERARGAGAIAGSVLLSPSVWILFAGSGVPLRGRPRARRPGAGRLARQRVSAWAARSLPPQPPKADSSPPACWSRTLKPQRCPHSAVSPGASPRQALGGQLQAEVSCPWRLVTVLGRETPSSSEGGTPLSLPPPLRMRPPPPAALS